MTALGKQLLICGLPALLLGATAQASTEFTRGEAIGLVCSSCHGTNGISFGRVPSIKGMSADRIESAMLAYKADTQNIRLMDRITKGYTEEDIAVVADYFGSMK